MSIFAGIGSPSSDPWRGGRGRADAGASRAGDGGRAARTASAAAPRPRAKAARAPCWRVFHDGRWRGSQSRPPSNVACQSGRPSEIPAQIVLWGAALGMALEPYLVRFRICALHSFEFGRGEGLPMPLVPAGAICGDPIFAQAFPCHFRQSADPAICTLMSTRVTSPLLALPPSSPYIQVVAMEDDEEDNVRACTTEIEDITQHEGNREILRRLKGDDATFSRVIVGHGYNDHHHIAFNHPNATSSDGYYAPDAADDLGGLGHYIGKNLQLKELSVWRDRVTNDQLTAFCQRVAANTSLKKIWFLNRGHRGVFPGNVLLMLVRFFEKNCNLTTVSLWNGCIADTELEALTLALEKTSRLKVLDLSHNASITGRGYRSLSALLENPNSCLQELRISHNNVGDEVALMLAAALTNNAKVKVLSLHGNTITARGWSFFSKLLCDASSPNATFLSNHTLQSIHGGASDGVRLFLKLNHGTDKEQITLTKILRYHPVLDMHPRFVWEYKLLPLVVGWLERAAAVPVSFEPNIDGRKLGTCYQFVREFPEEYFEVCGGASRRKRARHA